MPLPDPLSTRVTPKCRDPFSGVSWPGPPGTHPTGTSSFSQPQPPSVPGGVGATMKEAAGCRGVSESAEDVRAPRNPPCAPAFLHPPQPPLPQPGNVWAAREGSVSCNRPAVTAASTWLLSRGISPPRWWHLQGTASGRPHLRDAQSSLQPCAQLCPRTVSCRCPCSPATSCPAARWPVQGPREGPQGTGHTGLVDIPCQRAQPEGVHAPCPR